MSKPRVKDFEALDRLAKYLKGKERCVQHFKYQDGSSKNSNKFLNVWVDTDYAGCLETRKSTSGGIIMLNEHMVKQWASTQDVLSLSSGEAEYYGIVRGGAQALGIRSLLADWGIQRRIRIKTDASVAKSIASRRGVGKVRHIEVNQLWLQEKSTKVTSKLKNFLAKLIEPMLSPNTRTGQL